MNTCSGVKLKYMNNCSSFIPLYRWGFFKWLLLLKWNVRALPAFALLTLHRPLKKRAGTIAVMLVLMVISKFLVVVMKAVAATAKKAWSLPQYSPRTLFLAFTSLPSFLKQGGSFVYIHTAITPIQHRADSLIQPAHSTDLHRGNKYQRTLKYGSRFEIAVILLTFAQIPWQGKYWPELRTHNLNKSEDDYQPESVDRPLPH